MIKENMPKNGEGIVQALRKASSVALTEVGVNLACLNKSKKASVTGLGKLRKEAGNEIRKTQGSGQKQIMYILEQLSCLC